MLDKIVQLDKQFFIFLNGLGSETFDGLWLFITKQSHWTPFFLFILYVIYKRIGGKQTLYLLLSIAVLVALTDQLTNVVKFYFERLRPCSDPTMNTMIRVVKASDTFSFFSGHAANSMAVATFIYFVMKPYSKYFRFLFLWPFIFAYSRIYLGLHYPSDIICGYIFGFLMGFLIFNAYRFLQKKYAK